MSNINTNDAIVPGFDEEKDESLKIILEKTDSIQNGLFIYLNGYIDTYNSNFFQKKITKVIEAGFVNLIFSCSTLNYVSSTGIGSFTAFLKLLKQRGGDLVLLNIQPKVYEVFQLLGFSQFFNIKDVSEEAISFFKNDESAINSLFPKIFRCPICGKQLRATHAGRFRCPECKSIVAVDEIAKVSIG